MIGLFKVPVILQILPTSICFIYIYIYTLNIYILYIYIKYIYMFTSSNKTWQINYSNQLSWLAFNFYFKG